MAAGDPISNALAIFSANYLKRWLEGNFYDRLLKTALGQKLKSLDAKAHYGIEFGLNILTMFFDRALSEDTALKRMVKEVGLDAAPEISKRLINHAKNPQEKELIHTLLAMDRGDVSKLLAWLYEIDTNRRKRMLEEVAGLSVEELTRLSNMPPEDREKLLSIFVSERKSWLSQEEVRGIEQATEELKAFRARLRDKRRRRTGP